MKELDKDFMCNYEVGTALVDGKEVYYSDYRIPETEVPMGFHKYEVRGKDSDWTEWATIEKRVVVNFAASILVEDGFDFKITPHPWFNPFTQSDGCDSYYEIKDYSIEEYEEEEPEDWDGDYENLEEDGYTIVTWPDSQMLMVEPNYAEFCFLINDDEGLDRFGSCAYVVDKDWYDSL